MLCYVMVCYVMLCYVMLCYVMLWYGMLCYVMLCQLISFTERIHLCFYINISFTVNFCPSSLLHINISTTSFLYLFIHFFPLLFKTNISSSFSSPASLSLTLHSSTTFHSIRIDIHAARMSY